MAETKYPKKPIALSVRAENGVLIGTDQDGVEWVVRWCGNGQYSHWCLNLRSSPSIGWYVYRYPENDERELKEQITAAEHKHKIYS